ncbi:50S ribosomal protein L18 [Patescibacteria group bacterium]|jgi:large subunit ribosomal protein L18|nr:50S ribosomal protein L18 [Patescibacteria group bacterium]
MRNIKSVRRIRAKVSGTPARPRLCLAVSLTNLRAQLIDDVSAKTIASATTISNKDLKGKSLTQKAEWLGAQIAEQGKKAKIKNVVFDRGGKIYHGRVKAFAESARAAGLEF